MKLSKTLPILLLASTLMFAQHPKIAMDLDSADPSSNVDVIVQFKHAPTEAHHQKIRARGGVHKRNLDLVKSSLYSVPAGKLKELADDPDVAYISPDRRIDAAATVTPDYKLQAVNANIAQQYGWTGAGVYVAIIDSGISDRPDLHSQNGYNLSLIHI